MRSRSNFLISSTTPRWLWLRVCAWAETAARSRRLPTMRLRFMDTPSTCLLCICPSTRPQVRGCERFLGRHDAHASTNAEVWGYRLLPSAQRARDAVAGCSTPILKNAKRAAACRRMARASGYHEVPYAYG